MRRILTSRSHRVDLCSIARLDSPCNIFKVCRRIRKIFKNKNWHKIVRKTMKTNSQAIRPAVANTIFPGCQARIRPTVNSLPWLPRSTHTQDNRVSAREYTHHSHNKTLEGTQCTSLQMYLHQGQGLLAFFLQLSQSVDRSV